MLIRGEKVLLDADWAELYGVATKVLIQAVRRNLDRFPEDFMFRLNAEEFEDLRRHFGTSSQWGGRRYAPYAFTEQGVAMLSSVLHSTRAVRVNIEVADLAMAVCPNGPPDQPLVLCKQIDAKSARPGDVLTVRLKYTNYSVNPISDVVVSDSLAGRLEYVPGSARSDRAAVFTVQDNDAGSATLRWEIAGTLPPGQSGQITFQVRVR